MRGLFSALRETFGGNSGVAELGEDTQSNANLNPDCGNLGTGRDLNRPALPLAGSDTINFFQASILPCVA
jgi:hypothetical protein